MKVMIEKVFSIKALLSLLLVFAAGGAWAEADYINANFYYVNSGNAFTAVTKNNDQSVSDNSNSEGWSSYAVQGKYWNDVDIGSSAAQSVKTYDSSAGSTSESSVTVTISGSRGGYFSAGGFDHHILSGYIDDNADNTSPLVTFANIPFDYYKVVVYFAADRSSTMFGYITLNDTVNLYGDGTGTDIGIDADGWGGCAPHVSNQNNFQPGQNILVSPVLKNTASSTLKVQSRSYWPGATYRSGIAAIQVVKAEAPAACTYTVSEGGTYDLFGSDATSYWSASEPSTGSEAVTISISGDTTLTVNDSRVFASLTVTGSGTLTLAGTGEIVTPSVTVNSGVTLLKTTGQLSTSAAVSVPESSALEIANSCTWSGVISGAGSVAVSGREVVFSAANTYTGNLTIKSGGAAKSANTSAFGPDWRSVERYVVVEDGGVADINGNGMVLAYKIAGDGAGSGALISTGGNIADGIMQTKKIILTADASIGGTADWGLLANSYYATEMTLGSYTLTKKGSANFWICNATISGTGSFVIEAGTAKTIYNQYKSTCNNGKIKVKDGGKLWIGTANLDAKSITCDVGGTVEVSSGRQLLIKNGGDMTVNGTATITGTLKLAEDGTASSTGTLTVGGTVTVTGTVDIPHRANIVRSGTGKVDIKSGGKVHYDYVFKYVNSKDYGWKSDYEGDVFTGAGTLEIRTNRKSTHDATSSFSGIVKLYTASASNTGYINVLDGLTFTQRPEFITEGYYNLGNTSTLAVRDLSGSGVFWSNYSPSNLKYIDTKQTKPTTFSGTFLNDGAGSNTRDVGLTVRGSEDGVYALTLSGASTSRTALTIQDNGKVIFPSTGGSWSSGTVVVANGGYIEAQNTSALGTVDIQSGSVIVIPTVSEAPVALTCSTVTLPTSGTVTVDLSGVSVGEGESVPVISATSLVNANASIFRQTEGGWRFSVDNNTIKATKLGTATWSDGTWSDSDLTGYASASITASGTQDVTLPATTSFDTLTITGSGTVTLTSTSSETCTVAALSIGAGVTLNASSSLVLAEGCAISGEGTLDIPVGTTCTMNGVTCSAKVTVEGTLRTTGTTNLSAANTSAAGSLIEVVAGTTTLSSEWQGIAGDITVDANATLAMSKSLYNGSDYYYNHIAPGGNSRINVTGTIALGSSYFWNFGANVKLLLHKNGEITGSRTDYGSIGWTGNGSVVVDGDATINAPIRINDNISPILTVEDNVTLTISKAFLTSISNPSYGSVGGSITKAGAGTLCLKNVAMTKPISGSEGTLQLLSDASGVKTHTATSSFSGKVIITRNTNGGHHEIGTSASDDSNPGVFFLSGSPELEINGTAAYLCLNRSFAGKYMTVKNLSATSGTIDATYTSGGTSKTIKCLQTVDTTYAGNFNGESTTARYVDLLVYGQNETVKALTLSGASGSMKSYGTLTVKDYGKVIFSDSGDWAAGTVVVGANGYLESSSSAATLASTLTLQDGATVSFASGYTLNVGTTLNLPSGEGETVTFNVGFTPAVDGTTLVSCSAITAETDVSIIQCENAIIKAEAEAIKAYPVATVTTYGSDAVVAYSSVQEAINNASAQNGQYVTAYQSETVTATGQILLKIDGGAVVTLNSSKAGYAYDVGTFIVDGIYMFSDNVQVAATFKWKTAVASGSWGTTDNWTSDDGTVSRMPGSLDTVIFESAALVETPVGGFSFAALQANASVTIKRDKLAIDDRLTRTVSAYGAISGTGSLTLNDGVNLANASDASLSIGVPVTVAGATALTVAEGVAASFTGSGTLTLDALTSTSIVGDGWTGTVWLKNINSGNIVPANYGNANSTIRFTGVTGTIAQNETFTPAVELFDDGDTKALTIDCTTGYAANTATFSAIKGSGTFVTSSSNDQYPRTTFKVLDWSNFTGALNIDRGRLVFGTDTISADTWRYIYVSADVNVTIASGKTWNAREGVVVKGTLNMPSTASMTVNKYSGDGTVNITGTPANDPSLTFSSWTGTFVLPDFTSSDKFNLTAYGTSGSWIKLNDFRPGWLKVGALSISANLLLEGDFILTAMNEGSAFSFQTVSGSGNISLTSSAAPALITIANLAEFTGSIANSSGASLVITKRTLAEAPSVDDCILVSSTPDNVSVEGVYVGDTKQDIIIGKKSDGIYVAATAETETVGEDTVTVLDTGSNTAIDATGVSGKVAIPGTVTQISGVEAANLLLKVTYTPDGGDSTTGYYAGILTLDASGNVSLDPSGSVTIDEETVNVTPAVDTASTPMSIDSVSDKAKFTVKAIPGLYYAVQTGAFDGSGVWVPSGYGDAVQATSASTSVTAPEFSGTVQYYKIGVGLSATEAEQ